MRNEPTFTGMTFSLGKFHLSCGIQDSVLRLRASSTENKSHQLILSKMVQENSCLDLSISYLQADSSLVEERESPRSKNVQNDMQQEFNERVERLEAYISKLQQQIEANGSKSRKELRHSLSFPLKINHSDKKQIRPSVIIKQREEAQKASLIQREASQNLKLELLNDILQQKLLKREGDLIELQKSLGEREELIKQLAQKLIIANIEKEDIFTEYQKILQTNVFHKQENKVVVEQQIRLVQVGEQQRKQKQQSVEYEIVE